MRLRIITILLFAIMFYSNISAQEKGKQMVRLAIIEVDTTQIERYNDFLREEVDASIEKEPGVITLFAVAEKQNPEHITLFETYADSSQYRSHLATPHFQKYKQGTLQMVKGLALVEMKPLLYHRNPHLSKARSKDPYIRLIKMEIDSSKIASFNNLASTVMLPGIKKESGVLVMYAVSEKNHPTKITILEVYENLDAYNKHVKTPHFLKYKEESKNTVKALKFMDVNPILLGAKPQE